MNILSILLTLLLILVFLTLQVWRRTPVISARVFGCLLVLFCLTACGKTAPVVETTEIIKTTEVPEEVEQIVLPTETGTPTPEPPTVTPIPTITRTPEPTVKYSTEVVDFTSEDGYKLSGRLFLSTGDTAVVLAHMAGDNDQENWVPFAKYIARRGITALTFDFRCYGDSECGGRGSSSGLLSRDLGAAIDFLRKLGFEKIICIGASMGGRGCINVAFEQELAGLVNVAGTGSSDPDRQNLEDFISPDMPKLFIVTENDHVTDRALSLTRLYDSAPDPKILKIYPGTTHGTELFDSQYSMEFRNLLLEFLKGIH